MSSICGVKFSTVLISFGISYFKDLFFLFLLAKRQFILRLRGDIC